MKRVAVLVGMALAAPGVALAQIPVAPAPAAAPLPPPAAAPAPAPPPAPATAPAPAPAPAASTPPAGAPPGDEYFVEDQPPRASAPPPAGAPPGRGPAASEPPPFEPPVPSPPEGYVIQSEGEPPPPPHIRHVAPQYSLVLGARIGWFVPFGNVWAQARSVNTANGSGYVLKGVPWSDYASSGPMFEVDVGARLSRAYTAFVLWERAQLGSGDNSAGADGPQSRAETDFIALGLRASSNPDRLGFLTEVAVGYRRARTLFKNDVEYQFTDAPFEARLGLGAEMRFNRMTSLSGLVTVGVGSFSSVQSVAPNGNSLPLTHGYDQSDGHAWVTLTVGGHFDFFPSTN